MTEENFKRLLEDSLKPIHEEQKGLREEQVELRRIIEERVLPPVIYVEDKLGIQPPEELTIPAFD